MYYYKFEDLPFESKKYVISIGKRQPMHIGHKNSIEKLLQIKNWKLIYVMGSTNLKGDELFDPETNPLTIEQQIKQFEFVFGTNKDVIFLPINDIKDLSKWGPSIVSSLNLLNIRPHECLIHFVGKEEDRLKEEVSFKLQNEKTAKLTEKQWLIEILHFYNFDFWFDNEITTDLSISARNLRNLDLENISQAQKQVFAAYEYLLSIAKDARAKNPKKINLVNTPITLKDLTRLRLLGD